MEHEPRQPETFRELVAKLRAQGLGMNEANAEATRQLNQRFWEQKAAEAEIQ